MPPTATPTTPPTPTPAAVPAPPSALSATPVSRNRIDLAWTDNSGDETGFQVERSRDAVSWTQIAAPGANAVSYSDTSGLTPSKLFSYRFRAVNAAESSAWSNTASARVPRSDARSASSRAQRGIPAPTYGIGRRLTSRV